MSIAVGNASQKVQHAAQFVSSSSENEGFANAVDRFVLANQGKRTQVGANSFTP